MVAPVTTPVTHGHIISGYELQTAGGYE
ncbi:hypothetical protein Tco_1251597, partial [Tanacetum coccineum]